MWIKTESNTLINLDTIAMIEVIDCCLYALEKGANGEYFTIATCETESDAERMLKVVMQGIVNGNRIIIL